MHHNIIVNGSSFSWDLKSTLLTLRDVNMKAKWCQKVAVCEPVGAGKSLLLNAILGVSNTDNWSLEDCQEFHARVCMEKHQMGLTCMQAQFCITTFSVVYASWWYIFKGDSNLVSTTGFIWVHFIDPIGC